MKTYMTVRKCTLDTLKKFIRENKNQLLIKIYHDHYESIQEDPCPILMEETLGIKGVLLVGNGRDDFRAFYDEKYIGIEVSNCLKSFTIAARLPKSTLI